MKFEILQIKVIKQFGQADKFLSGSKLFSTDDITEIFRYLDKTFPQKMKYESIFKYINFEIKFKLIKNRKIYKHYHNNKLVYNVEQIILFHNTKSKFSFYKDFEHYMILLKNYIRKEKIQRLL